MFVAFDWLNSVADLIQSMFNGFLANPVSWLSLGVSVFALGFSVYVFRSNKKRDCDAALKSQANDVAAWFDAQEACVLRNNSALPVYDVVVTAVLCQGAGPRRGEDAEGFGQQHVFSSLPPGEFAYYGMALSHGMHAAFRPEIAFQDASGHSWVRRGNGNLEQLTCNPIEHYKIPRPFSYKKL